MKSESVRFDFNYMMEPVLGRGRGLKVAEIDGLKKKAGEIHRRLQEMRRAGTTPFYNVIFDEKELEPILKAAQRVRERFDNLVVLGIGGSALGARALNQALNPPHHNSLARRERSGVRLFVADNIDPASFASLIDHLDLSATVFNVISRSGETAETLAQFLVAKDRLERSLGPRAADHLLITTDAEKGPLRQIARDEGLASLALPASLVGRYSVFTAVGLLPAAATGIDVGRLLAGARAMAERCAGADLWRNPAYMSGALHYLAHTRRRKGICVVMPYSDLLTGTAEWFCQLWAESLGKSVDLKGKKAPGAQCPVRALGATDQHSQLQLYMDGPDDKTIDFIRVENAEALPIPLLHEEREDLGYLGGHEMGELLRAEQEATATALARKGRMSATVILDRVDPETIGQLLFMYQLQTVFAAGLYGVNPYDQPAVEGGKRLAYGMMARRGYENERHAVVRARAQRKRRFVV